MTARSLVWSEAARASVCFSASIPATAFMAETCASAGGFSSATTAGTCVPVDGFGTLTWAYRQDSAALQVPC